MRTFLSLLFLAAAADASITGVLIDERGNPVVGATIEAFAAEDSQTLRARLLSKNPERTPMASARSTDAGSFAIDPKNRVADLGIRVGGRLVVGLQIPNGEDAGTIVIPSRVFRKVRVIANGKPLANAVVAAGPFTVRTDDAGVAELLESSIATSRVWIIHPDFAIKEPLIGEGTRPTDVALTKGNPLRGRVIGADGTAVPHATITIDGWPLANSDDSGNFTIPHPPANWREVFATAGNRVGMAMNQKTSNVEIRVKPGATLTGVVRDSSTANPVGAVRVDLISELDRNRSESTFADEKGRFSFTPLVDTRYTIGGQHPGFTILSTDATLRSGGSTSKAVEARPLERIRGRVFDDQRRPVAGAIIQSGFRGNRLRYGAVMSGPSGEFTLQAVLPPVPMRLLIATKPGYAAGVSSPITSQSSKDQLTITLPRGFPLQIKVVDKQRNPVAGAKVILMSTSSDDTLISQYLAVCEEPGGADCDTTGAQGTATFRITEGLYQIQLTGEKVARRLMPKQTLTTRSSPLVVEADRGVEVAGRVVFGDGTPAAGVIVTNRTGGFGGASARTDEDGVFLVEGLPSGRVTLLASTAEQPPIQSAPVEVTAPAQNVVITLPKLSRIEGRVVDKESRQPVADFTIAPTGIAIPFARPQQFHSDDGAFQLERVPAGTVGLRVTSAGYAPGTRSDLAIEEGKTLSGVEVQLERGGKVTGRVTAGGRPLAGVAIRWELSRPNPFGQNVVTDADGEYVLDGIAAGERSIEFSRESYVTRSKSVDVTVGKETRLDVEMDHGRELRGRVVESSGRPISAARVMLLGSSGSTRPSYTDADGAFTLQGLADGRYTIDASKQGYVAAKKDVVIPSAEAVTLMLDTGGTIHGRVLGVPESELPSINVTAYGNGSSSRSSVESDGTFTLHGIPDGRVIVGAMRMGVRMTQSVPKQIDVANGSAPPVDIDFSEGAKISGHITRSGTPVQAGMVSFAPKNGPGGSTQIAPDGSYEMSLSNGDYNVSVYLSGNFNFQTKYTVTGPATFDIDIHGATLHGRVTDASTSTPIAEAEVWIQNNEVRIRKNAVSDSEGKFAIEPVPDATYELHATRAKYSPAAQTVVVAGGSAPDVEMHLEHGQEMTIRVVDGQSGTALQANAAVFEGRKQIASGASQSGDSAIQFWLQPGHYRASIYSRGYMPQTVDLPVPGPELRVALAQAGTIAITSKNGGTARITLVGVLKPMRTTRLVPGMLMNIEALTPGRYSVELLDVDGVTVKATFPANVVAGQTVRLNID